MITLSERAFVELAAGAERAGQPALMEKYFDKAVEASVNGGTAQLEMPRHMMMTNDPSPTGHAATGYPQEVLPRIDRDSPIVKAIVANGYSPRPVPYRVNDALMTLGHYNGIRDLSQATSKTFQMLKKVSEFPLIDAIIGYKIAEIDPFLSQPTNKKKYGFEIRQKNRKAPVTRRSRKRCEDLTHLMLHGGFMNLPDGTRRCHPQTGEPGCWDGLGLEKAVPLRQFGASFIRDSFSMDWACARTEPGGDPRAYPVVFFAPVASEMIRRTVRDRYQPDMLPDGTFVEYVEMNPGMDGRVVREFPWTHMFSMVRRPRTDFYGRGYGFSEIEVLLREIASLQLNLQFQKSFFDENHIPPGFLQINGMPADIDDQAMDEIRRKFSQFGGPGAMWKLWLLLFPPGSEGKAEFVAMRDQMGAVQTLQYSLQGFIHILNIVTSVFQMNPEAIGFEGLKIQATALNGEDPATALAHSNDKSRMSTLGNLETLFTEHIIERYDPDFEFGFVGAESHDQKAEDDHVQVLMSRGFPQNKIADLNDEDHLKIALHPDLYDAVIAECDEEKFDSPSDMQRHIETEYTKRFEKIVGTVEEGFSPWCDSPNAPTGNPESMKIYTENRGRVLQQIQTKQMQAKMEELGLPKGMDLQSAQQMQAMGYEVPGLPSMQPQEGEGGEEEDPNESAVRSAFGGAAPGQATGQEPGGKQGAQGGAPSGQAQSMKKPPALPPALQSLTERPQDEDETADDDKKDKGGMRPPRPKTRPAMTPAMKPTKRSAAASLKKAEDFAPNDFASGARVIEVVIRRS